MAKLQKRGCPCGLSTHITHGCLPESHIHFLVERAILHILSSSAIGSNSHRSLRTTSLDSLLRQREGRVFFPAADPGIPCPQTRERERAEGLREGQRGCRHQRCVSEVTLILLEACQTLGVTQRPYYIQGCVQRQKAAPCLGPGAEGEMIANEMRGFSGVTK